MSKLASIPGYLGCVLLSISCQETPPEFLLRSSLTTLRTFP